MKRPIMISQLSFPTFVQVNSALPSIRLKFTHHMTKVIDLSATAMFCGHEDETSGVGKPVCTSTAIYSKNGLIGSLRLYSIYYGV